MLGKSPDRTQKDLFQPLLSEFINLQHELVLLSEKINWKEFENEFSPLYSSTGTPSIPIRTMCGLLILKQLHNLGDETIMEAWVRDPYMQYFCGEAHFQHKGPCDPSDLVHFRKRIGEKGVEKIFRQSILIHGHDARQDEVSVDTSAQEKNITFPTDVKLQVKIIKKCNAIANEEGIVQRRSYKRKVKELLLQSRFANHPKRKKHAHRAQRKIKTIARALVRELERKLNAESQTRHQNNLDLFKRVLLQQRNDKNKIYSLHETEVACIAKGKAHKQYEFGSKVSIAITKTSGIIVGALSFKGNPHDSQTISPTLDQHEKLTGKRAKVAIVDRGYPARMINGTQVIKPTNGKGKTAYQKQKARKRFRRRAAIEPTISHMKHQYGMVKNYLKGSFGDRINVMMAAAAFNFKKWMNKIRKDFLWLFYFLIFNTNENQIVGQIGVAKD
jgi:IS5 family transposase